MLQIFQILVFNLKWIFSCLAFNWLFKTTEYSHKPTLRVRILFFLCAIYVIRAWWIPWHLFLLEVCQREMKKVGSSMKVTLTVFSATYKCCCSPLSYCWDFVTFLRWTEWLHSSIKIPLLRWYFLAVWLQITQVLIEKMCGTHVFLCWHSV